MENYIELLNESFHKAEDKIGRDELGQRYFKQFFHAHPETQSYFKDTDISSFGGKKLHIIFDFVKDIILHPNFAEIQISQEVMRHQMYGLTDKSYYFTLIDSLPIVIKSTLEENWSEDYEGAWNDIGIAFKSIIGAAVDTYVHEI